MSTALEAMTRSPLHCPRCGMRGETTHTLNEADGTRVIRRRRCLVCGHRWMAEERTDAVRGRRPVAERHRPWLYVGYRLPAEEGGPLTTAERADVYYLNQGGTWGTLRFAPWIPHHRLHSPSGWNWGYSGSGPAELARHLLWHATGRRALLDRPALYQDFKREVVANWGNGWQMLGDRIREWVAEQELARGVVDD